MGKIVAGLAILAIGFGFANAEEYFGSITKVDGKKVTANVVKFDKDSFKKGGFKKGEFPKGEEKTMTVTSDCKIVKRGKYDKETKKVGESVAIEDGLSNKMFTEASTEKPLRVRITTNEDGKITQISVGGGRGGKGGFGKKKKKDDNKTSY